MRRLAIAMAAGLLMASVAGPVSATGTAHRGFQPADTRVLGHSLVDIGTAWNAWAMSAPAATNPLVLAQCAQSPIDPRIWFLPEPIPGGLSAATCAVPRGAFLVVSPFFMECSQAEPDPFHGDNRAELRACVKRTFDLLTSVAVTLDGRTVKHLDDYVVTTRLDMLPADNLVSTDPTLTMNRGIFLVIKPLSRGTHTLSASWVVDSLDVQAAITFTIIVSRGCHGHVR